MTGRISDVLIGSAEKAAEQKYLGNGGFKSNRSYCVAFFEQYLMEERFGYCNS